jgi:beta-barrel assembly-enhancing protease
LPALTPTHKLFTLFISKLCLSKMKKLFLLFAFLGNTLSVFSQDFNDYQPLKNQGTLPNDFTVLPSVKYAKDIQKIDGNDKRSVKKSQKKFYLSSNFAIDGLLKSGRVLFETEHATYLKEILGVLLTDKPETAKKIRVYLLRSPSANAFATADGIVFVTLGLLAQVENEAQLAYILAHEVVHIDKKHALELVIQSDPSSKANDRQKLARNGELSDKNLSRNLFTQDQELEADREGYKLFAKTNYAQKNINRVFDVLKYSELPFDNLAFERSFLETEYYQFPNYFFSEKVRDIEGINEKSDDSRSSHPNLFKRRSEIEKLLGTPKDDAKKEYIVSKDRFLKLQKVSRFEIAQLQLHQQLFQDAIYTAFLLNKTEKSTQYPEIITAKALYGIAKFENNKRISSTSELIKLDSIEGESQQLYHFFYRMPTKDLVVFATSYVFRMSRKYPKNTDLKDMAYDLLWLVVKDQKLTEDDFSKTPPVAQAPADTTVRTPSPMFRDTGTITKLDRIKLGEKLTKLPEAASDWWKYTFVECLKDDEFVKTFKKMVASNKENNEDTNKKERDTELANKRKEGYFLGVQKVVVVNPMYIKATESQKVWTSTVDVNLIDSERNVARFEKLMKQNAALAGLNLVVLNPMGFKKEDAQKLNDYTLLKEWYLEQSDAGTMAISGYRQKEIEELAKKYNTDYFLWTGVIGVRQKSQPMMKAAGAFTALTIIGIPIAIWMVADKYEMYHYSIVYNVRTGRNYIIKSESFEKKDSDMLLNAHIYDTFLQIKTSKDGEKSNAQTESTPDKTVKKPIKKKS